MIKNVTNPCSRLFDIEEFKNAKGDQTDDREARVEAQLSIDANVNVELRIKYDDEGLSQA